MSAQQGRREFRLLRKVSRGAEAGRMFVGHRVAQVLEGRETQERGVQAGMGTTRGRL